MFGVRRCMELSLRLILSPQGRQLNRSLGINAIDNAEPCNPHDNIAGGHSSDECMISILPNVCHKLVSILWLIEQICSLTIECLVYQYVPNTSVSSQSKGTHLIILQRFPILPSWNCDHPRKNWRLCRIAMASCLPIRNISRHIFEHVLPCRRTT